MSHFEMRPFTMPQDLTRLAQLKNDYWQYYQLDQSTTPEKQEFLLTLENHSAPDDNRVITHPDHADQLIAHVWVWLQTPERVVFDITVHPDWQRQGLGSQLLAWAIDRAKELGTNIIDQQISLTSLAEHQFLRKYQFRPLGTFLSMQLEAPQVQEPQFPAGYSLKTYAELNDLSLYTHILNACYSDLWGHHTGATEEAQAKWLPYYDPTGIFILFNAQDEPIGIVRAQSTEQTNSQDGGRSNSIDAPGLLPAYREPDYYQALVYQALTWLSQQVDSLNVVTMHSWGDLDKTIDAYWQIGFQPVKHAIGYRYYLK